MQRGLHAFLALVGISSAFLDDQNVGKVICKDVAIIGGGAAGTFAAFRLREDFNKSIVVIERDAQIGGHVNTFYDTATNMSIEYGVQTYIKYGPAESFFIRLGLEIGPAKSDPASIPSFVNSANGELLSDYKAPAFPDVIPALKRYMEQAKRYNQYLAPGLWNFPAPKDIPDDLLLPFEEFAKKYDFEIAIPTIQVVANPGVGGFQGILALHVLAFAFGYPVTDGLLNNGFFNAANASNSALYEKAHGLLKDDILLKTSVHSAERSSDGIKLVVKAADGRQTAIEAKQLLIAVPPSDSNLDVFKLDQKEHDVFSRFTPTYSFVGILRTSALPKNHTVSFISAEAVPDHYFDLWKQPVTLTLNPKGEPEEQLWQFLIASNETMNGDQAKANVLKGLKLLVSSGTFKNETSADIDVAAETEILAFADHSSVLHREPAEVYKKGFIQDFYSLQGYRSTWYTGSLWTEDFSSTVWAFTDTVLDKMVKAIR
ncbi:Beta-cyclopiazonate dehydrogenase [Pseudocercospora fuligena]|uniref:Beta-cyclopiazonate dehydrogenase n=1 Tax=Pseudocercospora fuligena TaxID=685502 RepID=A0A8H6VNV2_9PEZI|nr:Beta-cyclopiazonate dehydrogenase [Pseudocercospora fuligena]